MIDKGLPRVSALVPMRNEEAFIGRCLDSIIASDYPADLLEVLVIDGRSTDRSREAVGDIARTHPSVRLLDNPGRTQATGLNVGVNAATGDVVVRMDAHTTYAPDYIRECVRLLRSTEASNVGGAQRAVGDGIVGWAIAAAMNSPFGAGDARFRYSEEEAWVDTVYLGAWERTTLEKLDGFDPDAAPNEDSELNYRLREAGGRILLSPSIRSEYVVRPSFAALAKQYYRYGRSRVRTLVLHPESLRWRQLAAPGLVLGLVSSVGLRKFSPRLASIVPCAYGLATVVASVAVARRRGWRHLPALPVVYAVMHLSWGSGFVVGLVRFGVPRPSPRALGRAVRPLDYPQPDQ
jgi:cellulose synthase/poly-beta-1,6-N-acetylglucosamine synthase-like glycosyltransferase